MGCWNKTCGLTQMPIFHGNKVICFYLIENPFETNAMASYSSGYWSYIPLPFYGEYDDYGFLDMDEGEQWKFPLMKKAYGEYVVINQPSNTVDNWTVDENIFDDYKKFKDAIHRDRLKFEVYHEKESCVSFVMFEKKTFDTLKQIYNPKELEKSLKAFKEYIKDESNLKIPDYLNNIEVPDEFKKEWVRIYSDNDDTLEEFCAKKKINKWNNIEYHLLKFWFKKDSSINEDGGFGSSIMVNILKQQIQDIPENILVDGFIANIILDQLRKQWYPAGHEGSQDEIGLAHKAFLKAYKNRMNDIKHRFDYLETDNENS